MLQNSSDLLCQQNTLKDQKNKKYASFSLPESENVLNFHRSIPSYKETPLHSMDALAEYLDLGKIWVKDESRRFGTRSFHFLGASYALAKWFSKKSGTKQSSIIFDRIAWLLGSMKENYVIAAAGSENYAYSVAYLAKLCGSSAKIFLPIKTSQEVVDSISKLGAQVEIIDKNYDETITHAHRLAKENDWFFMHQSTIDVDESFVVNVMQGYMTIISEVMLQLDHERPTHIFLQAGYGSFAAAIQAYLRNRFGKKSPKLILVEPQGANCFYQSHELKDGQQYSFNGNSNSMISSLNNGTPSLIAWPILRDATDVFISCKDRVSYQGIRIFHHPLNGDIKLFANHAGALTLGALFKICNERDKVELKNKLGLNKESKALLILTEGSLDKNLIQKALWEDVNS